MASSSTSSRTIRMVVPEGAEAGDMLTFKVPNTRQELEIPIPEGFAPGDVLEIQVGGHDGDADEGEGEDGDSEVQSQPDVPVDTSCKLFRFAESVEVEVSDYEVDSFSNCPDADGTGGYVWEAGKALCNHIATNAPIVHGKQVIEVGSGSGVVGIVCGISGASGVTLTDKPGMLGILEANIAKNQAKCADGCRFDVRSLPWGSDAKAVAAKDGNEASSKWDVVVGSDLLYSASPETFDALFRTIVSTQVAEVWLAVLWRNPPKERLFFELMSNSFDSSLEFGPGADWRDYGKLDTPEDKKHQGQFISVAGELVPMGSITKEMENKLTREQYVEYEQNMVQIYKFVRRKEAVSPETKKRKISS